MGTICSSNCYVLQKKNICFQHSLSLDQNIDICIYPKKLITKVKLSHYTTLKEFLTDTEQECTNIEYLELSYKHANELNDDDMAHIYKELSQFKKLKLFKINLSMKKISQRCLKILIKSLRKFGLLEFIDLNFYGIEKIQEQGLSLLCDCLQDFTRLNYLSLNLGWYFYTFFYFPPQTSPLKNSYKLNNLRGKINDNGIETLCTTLHSLPLLNYLSLNLRENIQLSKYDHLFKTILSLKYLQHLGLLLMQRNFSEDDFKKFIESTCKLKLLTSLHFEHNGFDIVVKNCKNFYSLGRFTQLVKLKIVLVVLIYTDLDSVINIQKGLKKLKNLEEIELYFNFKQPGDLNESYYSDDNQSQSECSQYHQQFAKLFKELSENSKLLKCKISINEDDICDIDRTKDNDSHGEK